MVSAQYIYTALMAFSTLLPQAAAHRRRDSGSVPLINARLVDASGRSLAPAEIADLTGRTVHLTVGENKPSMLKRDELHERDLLLAALYILAASEADDADAYADDLDTAE